MVFLFSKLLCLILYCYVHIFYCPKIVVYDALFLLGLHSVPSYKQQCKILTSLVPWFFPLFIPTLFLNFCTFYSLCSLIFFDFFLQLFFTFHEGFEILGIIFSKLINNDCSFNVRNPF